MNINRKVTEPLRVRRSRHGHGSRVITSLPAGKCVPLAVIPVKREDSLTGRYMLQFDMQETAEPLVNAVNVDVQAWLVPYLAFERFGGSMDIMNRSYMGEPPMEGESLIPFIETEAFGTHGSNAVYQYLGLHGAPTDQVNTVYVEAYNCVWNHRAQQRSAHITPRTRLQNTLAPAFWNHRSFDRVVPDWDQAAMHGEVPLTVVSSRMPVKGIGKQNGDANATDISLYESGGPGARVYPSAQKIDPGAAGNDGNFYVEMGTGDDVGVPQIFAELAENGITVSLANIALAKKTQAYARLQQQYSRHNDDWVVAMLMDGLSIPDQALKQPIMLAQQRSFFGMRQRYATDAANLTESAVNGSTSLGLEIDVPRLSTGGVIVITAEITPEQLFERQRDPLLFVTSVDQFPSYMRDDMDEEKVEIVRNGEVDTAHTDPTARFGFAPLNHRWVFDQPRVGGRFYRPAVDEEFDEDRQRFWAVETVDPVLSEDFYLCTAMHQKPFLIQTVDPFDCVMRGEAAVTGLTVFGRDLVESTDTYAELMASAPTDQIDKEED